MGKNRISLVAIFVTIAICAWLSFNLARWNHNAIINHDVVSYYGYLPATFIFHDLTFEFAHHLPPDFKGRIWYLTDENGNRHMKMTMGTAVLYAPFFAIAHMYAKLFGYTAYGYSPPYQMFIAIGAVVYLFLGLLILRKLLLNFFSDWVVTLTMLSLVFATNLFYYTTIESGMSHVYSFFLFSVFLLVSLKWISRPTLRNSILLGLGWGLITLVRPNNSIVIIIPLLLAVKEIGLRKLVKDHSILLITIATVGFLVFLPQMAYWKFATGNWLLYSYEDDQGFFFSQPQIINGLFSYRKGWLVYSPIMVFSLIGLAFLGGKQAKFRLPILVFTTLNIYIIFSWWCWWYGGSFGQRSLIESYAFLSLPLAAFFAWFWEKGKLFCFVLTGLVIFFISLSSFQLYQYRLSLLHWDSMTSEAYWAIFGKTTWPENYNSLIKAPDYEQAKLGIREYDEPN